ncbi:hypothetical protein DMB95_08195, partial [Campylobacter sp. MIT 12-8780]|uniref:DUF2972 domain-containing protein n=1 Tax=Campylobacter sp. MIT 12-8780 TaxID=2202200 RepID=UPI00115E0D69
FKEKYLETKHPYPALLDCDVLNENLEQRQKSVEDEDKVNKSLSYADIEADIAWELNLGLPKGYKFIIITASFTAHSAVIRSLKKCDVHIMNDHVIDDIKRHFIYDYTQSLENKAAVAINITLYNVARGLLNAQRMLSFTHHTSPILWVVRDPISRLKSSLNNSWAKANLAYTFDENSDLSALDNRLYFPIDINKNLKERIKISLSINTLAYAPLFEYSQKLGFSHISFLDFKELDENKLFDTFSNLAQKFDFNTPQNKDDFSHTTHIQLFHGILPLRYTIKNTEVLISAYKDGGVEISELLGLKKDFFERKIHIYTKEENITIIKKEKALFKEQIQNFILALKNVIDYTNENLKTTERKIIDLASKDQELRLLLKETLDKEADFIKQTRPDIIASWKYYNEFEKMCEELDN